jgi:hypothetical protein
MLSEAAKLTASGPAVKDTVREAPAPSQAKPARATSEVSPVKHVTSVTKVADDNYPNPYEAKCSCGWSARFSHVGLAANECVDHQRSFATA